MGLFWSMDSVWVGGFLSELVSWLKGGGVLVTLAFGRGVGGLGRIFVEFTPCHRGVLVCGSSVEGGRTGVQGFRWLAGDRCVVVGVIG